MKKASLFSLAIIAIGVFVLVAASQANADVVASKHNLSTTAPATNSIHLTGGTNADRVCVFCHTPHAASATAKPLWNRNGTDPASYTMYPTGGTIDMTIGTTPGGVSLACLSCHDGSIAFDSLLNGPGSGAAVPGDWAWNNGTNVMPAGGLTTIGTDLTNDHPIGVTYDNTLDTAFNPAADVIAAGLPLYGTSNDQVECGSCHDPHSTANPTFLRMSNAQSALCTTCHIK